MGVDPSSIRTGYAVLEYWKGTFKKVELGEICPPRDPSKTNLLRFIHDKVRNIAERLPATGYAIEGGFVGRNAYTSLLLGEVRGAVMSAFPVGMVVEVDPSTAKLSVTGKGDAGKDEVQRAVRNLLGMDEIPTYDQADAAAVVVAAVPDLLRMARKVV